MNIQLKSNWTTMAVAMQELKHALSKLAETKNNSLCAVGLMVNEFDDETRDAFDSALGSLASTRSIHTELIKAGFKIAREGLANHRNGRCRCKVGEQ